MAHAVLKYVANMGTQFQTVYVRCRTQAAGEKTIRETLPGVKELTFLGKLRGGAPFDLNAND